MDRLGRDDVARPVAVPLSKVDGMSEDPALEVLAPVPVCAGVRAGVVPGIGDAELLPSWQI